MDEQNVEGISQQDREWTAPTIKGLEQKNDDEKPLNLEDLESAMSSEDRTYSGNTGLNPEDARIITKMVSSVNFNRENPAIAGCDVSDTTSRKISQDPNLRKKMQEFKTLEILASLSAIEPKQNNPNLTDAERRNLISRGMLKYKEIRGKVYDQFGCFIRDRRNFVNETSTITGTENFINPENGDLNRWSIVKDFIESGAVPKGRDGSVGKAIFDNFDDVRDPGLRPIIDKLKVASQALKRGYFENRVQYLATLKELSNYIPRTL
ncbi:MAG: hypothetical protein ACD_58C00073G0005 [uncultured bacterium]|nr:MAG: hypothetical protein ACD_58C00073G0005 [uncultured bacterium]